MIKVHQDQRGIDLDPEIKRFKVRNFRLFNRCDGSPAPPLRHSKPTQRTPGFEIDEIHPVQCLLSGKHDGRPQGSPRLDACTTWKCAASASGFLVRRAGGQARANTTKLSPTIITVNPAIAPKLPILRSKFAPYRSETLQSVAQPPQKIKDILEAEPFPWVPQG